MKYRPHRGSLDESMALVVDVSSKASLLAHLREDNCYPFQDETLLVSKYCFDDRIGWDTYIVTLNGWPVGFTDGPLP